MSKDNDIFSNSGADITAMILKGSAGAVPIVGGLLAEITGSLIPNQRIDRIAEYVIELNAKLDNAPKELLESLRGNELFIDLVEESFIKASRAVTAKRRHYIVNIVENGISDADSDINNAKYLLGLLSDLNDNELIWLRYFHERTMDQKSDFRLKHQNVLAPIRTVLGDSIDKKRQEAIQASYTEHLERLGLVESHIQMNRDTGVPEYDTFTNKPKVYYTEATILGRMLLEYVGLIDRQPSVM